MGQEELPSIFQEGHIIDLVGAGEEESQLRGGRGRYELDAGERVGQVDPGVAYPHEIVRDIVSVVRKRVP